MADKLVEIGCHDWPTLRDLYAPNSPVTFLTHNLVDNFIRWTGKGPDFPNLVFYSLNGDWSDGTFAVDYHNYLSIFTLAASNDRLQRLLQLIDFSRGLKIHYIMSKDHSAILDVLNSKNLQFKYDYNTLMHHLPFTDALKFELTSLEGITLKSIEQTDVNVADKLWLYSTDNPPHLLRNAARFNLTVGAYDSEGRMIAWAFRLFTGLLGVLQVNEEFRGRGLGTLISRTLCRKIAESGQDIGASIMEGNAASLALFKELGFKIVGKFYFVETLPIE